jgi:acetyl-CoA carboxylase biotin carboxyl carrier protein
MMTVDEIRQILEMVREHDLAEFELEQGDVKLRLKKTSANSGPAAPALPPAGPQAAPVAVAAPDAGTVSPLAEDEPVDLAIVKSPIVGTFYRSPEPGAKSFVEVGQMVKTGQVLCIIEAMKLMNEINAEYDGEVVTAYVENGAAVQYGERLFAIKPL